MELPTFLIPFQDEARKYIEKKRVHEIEFSGSTYQVHVIDPRDKEGVWSFLQLDQKGQIKDCFCSCEKAEEEEGCIHIASAFLKIYGSYSSPLHQRFERSLWNKICHIYSDRMGDDPDLLTKSGKGLFTCKSPGGKLVCSFKGNHQEIIDKLKEIFQHRKKETEETSLKFSNLPPEEIALWREGRPSSKLRYELSFWSDLAKLMLSLQEEKEPYEIEFGYSAKDIPNLISVAFESLAAQFYISEANLPLIIPGLATVKSPLKVHQLSEEKLRKMTYDPHAGCLILETSNNRKEGPEHEGKGITINGWTYVHGDGFYVRDQHALFRSTVLSGKDVAEAFTDHLSIVKSLLVETPIHDDAVEVSYSIAFDIDWNLHITAYLFTPGDLSAPRSRLFGNWAYVDEGFYKLMGAVFNDVETVIPSEQMPEFVRQQRVWLNNQEGFETHIASIEATMTFHLSDDNYLSFGRKVAHVEEEVKTKEFGPWIYVSGQGFYSKVSTPIGLPLRPGFAISPEQIPLFIRNNSDELVLIPGFFAEISPIAKTGLSIKLEDESVCVSPQYEPLPAYADRKMRFFDDFVYIEGDGFSELPPEFRLPERFKHPIYIENENLPLFLTYEIASLRRYTVGIDPKLTKPEQFDLYASSIELSEDKPGHYALKLKYHTERGEVPVTQLWQAMKEKKRFLFHDAGLIDLEEKRFHWIRLLAKNQVDRRSHTLDLSTMELIRLNALEEIHLQRGKGEVYIRSKQILEEITQFRIPAEPDLTGLASTLRPYQVLGIRWLWFLFQHHLSGLLCDDMGLGKTHQAMALMAAIFNDRAKRGETEPCHFLVVCPTSVIFHWEEKLRQFLPKARICTFHGSDRSMADFHRQYDILLTSYGIWRNENELLKEVKFELAIFDEIQIAKNYTSRIYASLLNVDARMRLGLTGTPIENRLRELKSLFDIVLPSYMPAETDYREFFIKPIEKEGSRERRVLLTRLIKPFVLRRRKEEVLLDLPEKIEEISHCELLDDQKKLYKDILEKQRVNLLQELRDEKNPIPYLHVFALLSSLKQICDHPAVFLKEPYKYKEYQSGKWELFLELLSEARESQQKVVVFSQYLNMLDIIEEYLKETGIGYATIRGATSDRAQQVHRFNHDPDCEVFVGSIQAAGLGIDLTAGSVVIHYDRWWNAAREDQATDRVHRMGQTRGVQVFKLVTLDTFEEKIDKMITKKASLMEEVIGIDDHQIVKQFSRDDIIQLLQYTGI